MISNKKWFTLLQVVIFVAISGVIMTVWWNTYFLTTEMKIESWRRIQASNYSSEWIEMMIGYIDTKVNKDKTNGWNNFVAPLWGKYSIKYNGDYIISTITTPELMHLDKPYYTDFRREVYVKSGWNTDIKEIVSKVYYTDKKYIELKTTKTNINSN